MRLNDSSRVLDRFLGLNNVADPMRGFGTAPDGSHNTWEWQSVADNVNGTNSYGMERRDGYTLSVAGTAITASFSTFDYARLYIIDSGDLKRVNADGSTTTLHSSLSGTAYWSEQNDVVYLSCGTSKLEIHQDNTVRRWGVPTPDQPDVSATNGNLFAGVVQIALTYTDSYGREGGACPAVAVTVAENGGLTVANIPQLSGFAPNIYMTEADGTVFYRAVVLPEGTTAFTITSLPIGPALTTQFLDECPETAGRIAFMGANAYAAEYIPEIDQTVVWFTENFGYHLFNLNSDYFIVPGEVTQLFGSEAGLLVATHNRCFVYDNDTLVRVAEYGAVPGQHADRGPDGKTYFWTKRGLCCVMPFENLTEANVSVAPGVLAGGGIIEKGGYRRYIAVLHTGGDAYNARS